MGDLLLLGVEIVKEILMIVSGTNIVFLLIKVAFTVKGDCGRFLDMRLAERPGHDVKWPWLMAVMKVDLTGLKAAAWKYLESSCLFVS